jgi:hypothetical protein
MAAGGTVPVILCTVMIRLKLYAICHVRVKYGAFDWVTVRPEQMNITSPSCRATDDNMPER